MSSKTLSNDLLRGIVIIAAVLVLLPMLIMGLMMVTVPMMGTMGGWHGGSVFSPIWNIGMLFVWLGVLLVVGYLLYRGIVGDGGIGSATTTDPALEELRLAYARGELSDEEFETRREKLDPDRQE